MQVPVVLRALPTDNRPDYMTAGDAPYAECPLVVTPVIVWSELDRAWKTFAKRFQINHKPTGYRLGQKEFVTRKEALAFLDRCDPHYPAWPLAKSGLSDPATVACFQKFKMANDD